MSKRLLVTSTDLMMVQFLLPHIIHLSESGYEVEIACSEVGGRLDEVRAKLQGHVQAVHQVRLHRSPASPDNLNGYRDMKRVIAQGHYDLIWTNEPVMGVVTRLAARQARKAGTKVIYMAHGFHFYDGAPKMNWMVYYRVEKYCSKLCDMIITINEEDYQRAKTFYADRVEKIPGIGVNLDSFTPNEESRVSSRKQLGLTDDDLMLLTVGELTPRKNQHVLIEALHLLNNPRLKLYICGRGELEQQLRQQVESFGLTNQVYFLGYRKDIPALCCASDLFVFSSLQEGLPRALLEAMANEKAIVCSRIRGNVDIITDGKGGYVIPNDAESMAESIRKLIANPDLRRQMGAFNAQAVNPFREEESLKYMHVLFNQVCK